MLASRRASAFAFRKSNQNEISYVSVWSGQIANAMLLFYNIVVYVINVVWFYGAKVHIISYPAKTKVLLGLNMSLTWA